MVLPLTIILSVGIGVSFVAAMASFGGFAYFKIRRQYRKLTSGMQSAGLNVLLLIMYSAMLADCSQPCTLMRSDGVQVPWLRSAVNVVIFFAQQWIVGALLNLNVNAQSMALVLATGGGLGFMAADFSTNNSNLNWVWWSISVVLVFIGTLFNFYLSSPTRNGANPDAPRPSMWMAFATFAFSLIWSYGAPLIQALGPTIGQVSDTPPYRQLNEILWLVLYFVGVQCFGLVALLAHRESFKQYTKVQ